MTDLAWDEITEAIRDAIAGRLLVRRRGALAHNGLVAVSVGDLELMIFVDAGSLDYIDSGSLGGRVFEFHVDGVDPLDLLTPRELQAFKELIEA